MPLHRAPKLGQTVKIDKCLKFHIDYDWWEKKDRELRVYLHSHLCPMHQEMFADFAGQDEVDWIDPRTAEVRRVDGLEHTLHAHCSQQPDYITPGTSLINALFKVFLANGNAPLSVEELAAQTGRPAEVIARTLSGVRVYKGILPVHDDEGI